MKLTIIGWYGTETLGDRAILSGIINLLSLHLSSFSIRLGSLYPILSERTLNEDIDFINKCSQQKLKTITIFDSLNQKELETNIKQSDVLMVGGGPLMDLFEMYMLEYANYVAKKNKIPLVLCGCGWGPLSNQTFKNIAVQLVSDSSLTIFRDDISLRQYQYDSRTVLSNHVLSAIDPAFFACGQFLKQYSIERNHRCVAVNFRDLNNEGNHYIRLANHDVFQAILKDIIEHTDCDIELIPMHTFAVGGDDRIFLDRIAKDLDPTRIFPIHQPLNLFQTMEKYYHASLCVGMRFHSIVLQSLLNGNNYIVDYTDSQNGKIRGFIKEIDNNCFYTSRYFSLTNSINKLFSFSWDSKEIFSIPRDRYDDYVQIYSTSLKTILS